MPRLAATAAVCAALYGLAIGMVHSPLFAARNLVKLPLLLLATAALCGPAYYLLARLLGARAGAGALLRLVLRMFHDTALLLAALAPASLFLALTLRRPDGAGLADYPLFLGLNVTFVAAAGALALARQARGLLRAQRIGLRRGLLVVASWLAVTLLVGGQWAWYLRPFFGVSRQETPFCLGSAADYRGATNFYEAVYHLVRPPPLPSGFLRRGWR